MNVLRHVTGTGKGSCARTLLTLRFSQRVKGEAVLRNSCFTDLVGPICYFDLSILATTSNERGNTNFAVFRIGNRIVIFAR